VEARSPEKKSRSFLKHSLLPATEVAQIPSLIFHDCHIGVMAHQKPMSSNRVMFQMQRIYPLIYPSFLGYSFILFVHDLCYTAPWVVPTSVTLSLFGLFSVRACISLLKSVQRGILGDFFKGRAILALICTPYDRT
jgi:hypothetical protein